MVTLLQKQAVAGKQGQNIKVSLENKVRIYKCILCHTGVWYRSQDAPKQDP